uniref:Uncharacterized protein n=2 Tax=Oryza TaxID=4527 RepID=A0A0D3HA88_9ORYZ
MSGVHVTLSLFPLLSLPRLSLYSASWPGRCGRAAPRRRPVEAAFSASSSRSADVGALAGEHVGPISGAGDAYARWDAAVGCRAIDPGCGPGRPCILTVPAAIAIAVLRARPLVLPDQEACQDHAGVDSDGQTAQSMNLQSSQCSGAVVSTAMADDGIAAVMRRSAARFIIQDITTQTMHVLLLQIRFLRQDKERNCSCRRREK